MRQTGVDPGESEDGQQTRDYGNDEEIVVVGRSFLQPVRIVTISSTTTIRLRRSSTMDYLLQGLLTMAEEMF